MFKPSESSFLERGQPTPTPLPPGQISGISRLLFSVVKCQILIKFDCLDIKKSCFWETNSKIGNHKKRKNYQKFKKDLLDFFTIFFQQESLLYFPYKGNWKLGLVFTLICYNIFKVTIYLMVLLSVLTISGFQP